MIVAPDTYMTIEAYDEMAPKFVKDMRTINCHAAAMPKWWIVEIFNGFRAHLVSFQVLNICNALCILTLREECSSFHIT